MTRTPPADRGGRYGLLLLVLVGTYLLTAFSGATVTTELQVVLFALVLLIALRNSPWPPPWPTVIGVITVLGTAVTWWTSLSGSRNGKAAEDLWKALLLLLTVVMVVRRVLAKRTVTIQSIYGALSAYLIIGLMFASSFAAVGELSNSDFFASGQPADTQTYQYFSFTTLTTLGYGDFTAAESGGRSIAVLEALTGQVFLATLVARLVAAYRTPDRPEPPEPSGRAGRSGRSGRSGRQETSETEDADPVGDDKRRE